MQRTRLTTTVLLCTIGLLITTAAGNVSADALKMNVSDYRYCDVNTNPRYPLQGQPAEILVTVHNTSKKLIKDVTITIAIADSTQNIGSSQLSLEAEGTNTAHITWTPENNGWHNLSVRASSASTGDEITVTTTIPVLSRQFYFQWYTRNWEEERELRWANMVQFRTGKTDTYDYWKGRGMFIYPSLGWSSPKTPEAFVKYLERTKKFGGLVYDELNTKYGRDLTDTPLIVGFQQFTKENPDIFTALYVTGSLNPTMANLSRRMPFNHFDDNTPKKTGVDLLLLESYHNYQITSFNSRTPYAYFDQRIGIARDYDVLEYSIMILGYAGVEDPKQEKRGRGPYWVKPYELEDQVRYIRRHAPEMPGIGFYGHPLSKDIIDWNAMVRFADELCLKYFVKPVITIWDRDIQLTPTTPHNGNEVTLVATIHNIGGMDAKDVLVSFYDGNPLYNGQRIGQIHRIKKIPADEGMPLGRFVVKQNWTAKSGHREIFVTVTSDSDEVTLLDTIAKRCIMVR